VFSYRIKSDSTIERQQVSIATTGLVTTLLIVAVGSLVFFAKLGNDIAPTVAIAGGILASMNFAFGDSGAPIRDFTAAFARRAAWNRLE
jgi:hypothetical protein